MCVHVTSQTVLCGTSDGKAPAGNTSVTDASKCQMSTKNRNKFQITGRINICLSQLDGAMARRAKHFWFGSFFSFVAIGSQSAGDPTKCIPSVNEKARLSLRKHNFAPHSRLRFFCGATDIALSKRNKRQMASSQFSIRNYRYIIIWKFERHTCAATILHSLPW